MMIGPSVVVVDRCQVDHVCSGGKRKSSFLWLGGNHDQLLLGHRNSDGDDET
jgi:hypothetical protein